jgi:hypothetical protein
MYNTPYQLSVNLPMCLRENQHFHELNSHGSNAVVVRVEQLHDDLLHVDHEAPGRLHAVRDGLGLAQPFQRGPKKIIILIRPVKYDKETEIINPGKEKFFGLAKPFKINGKKS